jgi:hypothetical protein
MKIEITGNPGTGNTFSEVHIGYVNNYNPNATTVVQNYYDGKQPDAGNPPREVAESNQHNAKSQPLSEEQRSQLRKQIKDYVNQLSPNYVTADWRDRYDQLWDAIIDLPEVSAKIYDHGHQDWPFNGYLIAHIMHLLREKGIIKQEKDATLARALEEKGVDSSIRRQLSYTIPDKDMHQAVINIIETFPNRKK